ncbi:fructose 1,6-bisphosphatase [Microbacterium sp. P06]|uniref:fructose 1,6-bisphosphatase n=1 Tax=Microbacterium sp. P06 TaxID=3366949 RepID=UPI003746A1DB
MRLRILSRRKARLVALAVSVAVVGGISLTGCTQLVDAFNSAQGITPASNPTAVVTPEPQSTASMDFESQFTYDGSVSLKTEVAADLEVKLDIWAVDSKRTQEWTTDREKTFGFAVNAYDNRVDEIAVLAQKRRVFISSITITSETAQTSGQVQSPFQFSADPRTLVPSDTIRSDRGLLLNSFQGGLHVPMTTMHQMPKDTYGATLEFAMDIWVEGTANDENSFSQQTVYQYLPVAIYPAGSAG